MKTTVLLLLAIWYMQAAQAQTAVFCATKTNNTPAITDAPKRAPM